MAGHDTTPYALFNNVPRRPRSAASWPRWEEPDGGDSGGTRSVSRNASPPAITSVASNKRPAASSTGGGAEHARRAKKHRRLAPIDEPKPEPVSEDAMPLALSHKDKAAAAVASSSEAEPAVDWAENERRRKGKTPTVNADDDPRAAVARRPPAGSGHGKLLGDAIRSHRSTAVAGAGAGFKPSGTTTPEEQPKKKPKKEKKMDSSACFWCGTGKEGMSSAGSDLDHSFDRIGVVSDRLRTTLRGLGVVAPVRRYGKVLTKCDRSLQQSRLLMSYKKLHANGAESPISGFLTEEEKKAVDEHEKGLPITAYDRGGDAYQINLRFLGSNDGYRLIHKWGDFLRHNGLVIGKREPAPVNDVVMVDLWLFRAWGGKVGMVVLHYRRGDAAHADAALDEVEQRRLQLTVKHGDAADVMEDDVGDANEDDGVNDEVAAAAPAPSSPSEPNGGGATEAAEAAGASGEVVAEEQARALGEVGNAPSTSSELHGGAGRSDEVTTPLSLGDGHGTEDGEQKASGTLMLVVLEEVEAATESSLDSNAGGLANEVATPPSSEDEDEDPPADPVEAAARRWNVTKKELEAALGLVKLSQSNST